jgi:hypothetical protein
LFGLDFFESLLSSTFFGDCFFQDATEMPRKTYVCRTCGSSEVFHHCVAPRAETIKKSIASKRSSPQKAAVPFYSTTRLEQNDVLASERDVPSALEITKVAVVGCARDATPSSTKMSNMCDNCDSPHSRIMKGINITDDKVLRVEGDKLCSECYDELSDEVGDFIPRPGFSKPAGQFVGRSRHLKRVSVNHAITLSWCYGKLRRAVQLKRMRDRVHTVAVTDIWKE